MQKNQYRHIKSHALPHGSFYTLWKYKQFSDAAGLPTHKERMSVAKFHHVKTATELKRNRMHYIKSSADVNFAVSHGNDKTVAQVYSAFKSEFTKYQTKFGSVDLITQVLLVDRANSGAWGAFDDDSGIITIAGANSVTGFQDLAKTAKKMFRKGEWSSDSKLHTFRHELTHAW
ncbi:MAG: hypothetical protein IIU58_06560, partial [Clostridia bacterium]|nr:hypothetical protein [Clostridia bacterium]